MNGVVVVVVPCAFICSGCSQTPPVFGAEVGCVGWSDSQHLQRGCNDLLRLCGPPRSSAKSTTRQSECPAPNVRKACQTPRRFSFLVGPLIGLRAPPILTGRRKQYTNRQRTSLYFVHINREDASDHTAVYSNGSSRRGDHVHVVLLDGRVGFAHFLCPPRQTVQSGTVLEIPIEPGFIRQTSTSIKDRVDALSVPVSKDRFAVNGPLRVSWPVNIAVGSRGGFAGVRTNLGHFGA
ncbi:hypothetical protein BJ322DRAFT_1021884 [Thelephora terrestris]|uniref:Secreted protein n=1 Tax=Thelephora terrestris TaxID=56493 RepID=A0A9P6HD21_9AGAM|nr:hypothetical protein BJ322DRAFT_1021884 [Thelephora terrestris]